MATIQLSNLDARLTFLALQYHLARPGSELDPETKQPVARGLAVVATTLEPQLERAVATVELNDEQRGRLASAMAGAVNELKSLSLFEGGARTTVPAFHEALGRFFPDASGDADEAVQLAAHLVQLRRKLDRMASDAAPSTAQPEQRPWWRFWRRAG